MLSVASQPFMLNVVMLNVVKLDVVAPVTYNPLLRMMLRISLNDTQNVKEREKDNRKAPRHSVE